MNRQSRVVLVAALSIVALGFAALTTYLFSILLLGEWKYVELFLPTFAALLASLFAAVGASFVLRRQAGVASVVRTAALLIAGCGTLAVGIYFGLLANCTLSCGETVVAESESPNGAWKAVWIVEHCSSVSRACPTISHVRVSPNGIRPILRREDVFSAMNLGDLRMEWKADDRLTISYIGTSLTSPLTVLTKRDRLGTIHLDYLPIGWL